MTQNCLTRACKISSDWFSIPEAAQMLLPPAYDGKLNTAASQAATSTAGCCKTMSFIAQASEQGITLLPSPSTELHTGV